MALSITEVCVNCWACEQVCPTDAISQGASYFSIDAARCTECDGEYADPQCASICPVETAIVDMFGEPLNPIGSLTGIPQERRDALRAAGITL